MSEEGTKQKLTPDDLSDLYKRADKLGYSTAQYAIHLERQAAENEAAIRALDSVARELTEVTQVDDEGFVTKAFRDAFRAWADVIGKHAAAIARATQRADQGAKG